MEEIYKVFKTTSRATWEVSNYGNVKRNGKIAKLNLSPQGYLRTSYGCIHRLVAELFIPNPDNKPEVDHIDANKLNNHVNNLRWVTKSENMMNPITRLHNSESQKQLWTESYRKNMSDKKKTYYIEHPEARQKISELQKTRLRQPCSEETKEKIRIANIGHTLSEEAKEKLRAVNLGKKHSEETKQKMREAWRRRKSILNKNITLLS